MASTDPSSDLRSSPGEHGARAVVVVGDGAALIGRALGAHLDGWRVLGAGDEPACLTKLTILSADPAPDASGRELLRDACAEAVSTPGIAAVEVIADWSVDAPYRAWCEARGIDPESPAVSEQLPSLAPVLAAIVRRGGPRVPAARAPQGPGRVSELIGSLLMVGVSVEGRLGTGLGPVLPHVTPEELAAVKLPQRAVYDLLRELRAEAGVGECLVWNTCARMEVYAWTERGADLDALCVRLRERLLAGGVQGVHSGALRARDAWLHVLRTACGLNSTMPGDAEVLEQLRAAQRMAAYTGAAGPWAMALIEEVERAVGDVRASTRWGAYMREYTHAALDRVLRPPVAPGDRCLVVGGSTTSCSVLRYLVERGVGSEGLTIVYRGEGRRRLVQQVRQIAGERARRLRVGSYDGPELRGALRDADLVVLGVDRREPVLTDGALDGRCERPLRVVDFNTHGSTRGLGGLGWVELIDAGGLAAAVEEAAREALGDEAFHAAAVDAERAIAERVAYGA